MLDFCAIGLIESNSIAKGIVLADFILKKAPVKLLLSNTICPGKYAILFTGDEVSCEESLKEAKTLSNGTLVDSFLIPQIHANVIESIMGISKTSEIDSIGIIETYSIASCIKSADICIKSSNIELIEIRLAMGIGGKAFFTFTGELHDVESGLNNAKEFLNKEGLLCGAEIIPAPHEELESVIL